MLSKKASSQGMAPGRVSLERKVSSRSLRRNTSVSSPMADTPSVPNAGAPTNSPRFHPCAVGVSTLSRFLTSSSTFSTRCDFVHE